MSQLTSLEEWSLLEKHCQGLKSLHYRDFVAVDAARSQSMRLDALGISLDYSRQPANQETLTKLIALAHARQLTEKIASLFQGDIVNPSEKRPALHMALRAPLNSSIPFDASITDPIHDTLNTMKAWAHDIEAGHWQGTSGKAITDVVHIGIGGSDLGPKLCIDALRSELTSRLRFHFISDGDPLSFSDVCDEINPETTLFIVVSKSFNTPETLLNAKKAKALYAEHGNHFIAVTENIEKANTHGFTHILPLCDFVGGRYSLCSAVNFTSLLALGPEHFDFLLAGSHAMDQHVYHTPIEKNMAALLALIGIWQINFMGRHTHALLCYSKRLQHLVPYIQQLDMESNGKRCNNREEFIDYHTGPVIWGGLGNRAQHAFYQSICQGTQTIPCDFILLNDNPELNGFAYQKIEALSQGTTEVPRPSAELPGNIPVNVLTLEHLDAHTLGALIALYEHKVYCQSVIWNINPFDQPGVESTKQLPEEQYLESTEKSTS